MKNLLFSVFLAVFASSGLVSAAAPAKPPRCTYSITPSSAAFGAAGGTGSITLTTSAGCTWTAVSNVAFVTVTGGSSGTGSGTVAFRVAANSTTTSQTGTITVGKKTFTVTQAAAPAPNQPPTANAGAAQTVAGGATVSLNGSGTDPESQPLTFAWIQTAGASVALSSASVASPTFTAPAATSQVQTLSFRLIVNDNVQNSAPATTTVTVAAAEPPPPALDPAFATGDIGTVGLAGSATSSNGTFTVKGAGADIWGAADSFRFVYQQLNGDGSVVARLVSMQNTNAYAKAGIMVRGSLAAGAGHVLLDMKPSGEVEFMSRSAAGGSTAWLAGSPQSAPVFLKLTRAGSTFSSYVSKDGAAWTKVGSATVNLPATLYAGLVVCSHDTAALNTSIFDRVEVAGVPSQNLPPTADAGQGQTVSGGSTVMLGGSGMDPEGQALTFRWTQVAGTPVSLSDSTVPEPTFVAPAAASLEQAFLFQLVVNDGVQDSQPSSVTVTVQALAPPPPASSLLPPRPTGGATISVPAGANLQAAIDAARPGDVIVLDAGATYTGNFQLPAKGGTSYIMIRSSAAFEEGTRVSPASPGLARLASPSALPALVTKAGASFYWLEGLELRTAGGVNDVVRLGDGSAAQNSLSLVPHDLVVSHCYIHGLPGVEQKRGIALNSGLTYIADSHIDEIKGVGYDTQAIGGWNGPGPYRIYNNLLSAAGEVFMLGGDDPKIPDLVPTDVTLKGNLLTRPTSWRGTSWTVKNIFELKNAQQVLVDGNVFEYHWQAGQSGPAIVLTPRNQGGGAPWVVVRDVRFVNNRVRHVAAVFNILGYDNVYPSQLTRNIVIANNVFEDVSAANWGGTGRLLLINGADSVELDHNTVFQDGSSFVYAYGDQTTNFVFTSTIVPHGAYGILGDAAAPGLGSINQYFPGAIVRGNVIVAKNASYPAGNYYPATWADVGFANLAAGDYCLVETSPYKRVAADGADPGAEVTKVVK